MLPEEIWKINYLKLQEQATTMTKKNSSMELLTTELEKINSTLWIPKGGKGAKSKEARELEVPDLTKIATSLVNALNSVKIILEEAAAKPALEDNTKRMNEMVMKEEQMEEKINLVEKKMRTMEDAADHHHQRSLKGKLFITSTKVNSAIKSEKQLEEEGISVARHVTDLMSKKLGVTMSKEDIKSCITHIFKLG